MEGSLQGKGIIFLRATENHKPFVKICWYLDESLCMEDIFRLGNTECSKEV